MKNYHILPTLFWIGLSLFIMILSYKMGLGKFRTPGPGLMPFLVAAVMLLAALYLLTISLLKKAESVGKEPTQPTYWKIGLVLGSLFFFALLLERLGYLIVTFLFFIPLFRSMGNRWGTVWVTSVLTVLITYFGFTFLGVRFPTGILRF